MKRLTKQEYDEIQIAMRQPMNIDINGQAFITLGTLSRNPMVVELLAKVAQAIAKKAGKGKLTKQDVWASQSPVRLFLNQMEETLNSPQDKETK